MHEVAARGLIGGPLTLSEVDSETGGMGTREETVKSVLSHRDGRIVLTVTTFEGRVLQAKLAASTDEYLIEPSRLVELVKQHGNRIR